jgi:hypothetical protein
MRSEIRNSRNLHVLVLKEFVNQFTMHGMKNANVLLTVHLSIILVINQLNAQILVL